ncbi:MAG: 50S ribosomal protein L1 [Nanoarchaeota archaeon]|nr:50S ribosomal protein L1 [Nanoarchaeota archaeon]
MAENVWLASVRDARQKSKDRKFSQTWDLMINVKGLDLKRPENRLNTEFVLPQGRGKAIKVVVIADSIGNQAREVADLVIEKEQILVLAKDKKKLKQIADEYDYFLGEVTLMAQIGKTLGTILGPRGKIPKPLPPKVPVKPLVERARRTVRISLKDTPVIHTIVGTDTMEDEKIAQNAEALFNFVRDKLPKGLNSIRSVYLKRTMGAPVKVNAK